MTAGGFFLRRAGLVEGKAIGTLFRRGKERDHLAPRHLFPLFAKLCPVEGREIGEIAVGDRTGAKALRLIARMLAEVMRVGAKAVAHHCHAFGGGGIYDLGAEGFQRVERFGKHRDHHVMIAHAGALGLEIIGEKGEVFPERDRGIIGGLHLLHLPFDPRDRHVRVHGREGMGDDHVDRQVQRVEHRAAGLLRVIFDGVAFSVTTPRHALAQLEVVSVKRHAGVRSRGGQEAELRGVVERAFLAGVERSQKADQVSSLG